MCLNKNEWTEIFIVFSATLTIISDGMNYGWSSGSVPVLKKDDSPVGPITDDEALWIEEIYWIGGIMGIFISMGVADRLGRKRSVLFSSAENLLSWIIIAVSKNMWSIYVARFINGSASILAFTCGPMYIAECATPKIRGFLVTFVFSMLMLGILLSYSVLSYVPIWASSCIGASINVTHIIIFSFMPESPYFWLMKGKVDKAEKSLRRLRAKEDVTEELQSIQKAVERQSSERGRFVDLIKIASNRKALIICTSLAATQHLVGVSVILMNLQMIFEAAKTNIDPTYASILFAVVMLLTLFVGSTLVDRFGRKFLLIFSCITTAMSLGCLGIYFLLIKLEYEISSYIPFVALIIYAIANRMGISLVPVVINGEIFPTSVKAMGSAMSNLVYSIMAIISIKVYYATTDRWGIYVPFISFSVFALIAAIFIYFYIPETKGKTLEEIQMKLKNIKSTEAV